MADFTPVSSLLGGLLIGSAASLLLVASGRIAGISGILGGLIDRPKGETGWRVAFLAGLLAGGFVLRVLVPGAIAAPAVSSPFVLVLAGLLVGFGTRLGNGCTSGHGVCGVSRLSPRSIAATATFMAAGMLTTFVVRHLLGSVG
jgi:uncharacterized membrane protein YedE/YeeE